MSVQRYEALSAEEIESKNIHRAHVIHALASLWLFLLIAIIAIIWEFFLFWVNPNILIVATGTGFCVVLFFVVITAWSHGTAHIDVQAEEYRADKLHQRKMEIAEHKLREQQWRATMLPQQKQLPAPIVFGKKQGIDGNTLIRVDAKPPEDFLRWLWTEGNRGGTPQGEQRIASKWGDASDGWLDELAKLGWIEGRDANTRKPGSLRGSLDDVLIYFNYSPAPPIVTDGNIER